MSTRVLFGSVYAPALSLPLVECRELGGKSGPTAHPELVVHVREVRLDGLGSHEQLLSDLLVGESFGDEADNLVLGGCEGLPSGGRSLALARARFA